MPSKVLLGGGIWLAILLLLPGCTRQGPYPSRHVTVVCPWSAGGGTDATTRYWADALQRKFGEPFLVVNKTGGGGAVGHAFGALSAPDGYTITTITFELCTMHQMGLTDLTYEAFRPVLQYNADPAAIVVRKDAPWNSLRELLDEVRQNPGKIKMSGTARGGAWDLARCGLLLADGQSADNILWVPTQGAGPSLVELLGGHLDAVCCSVPEAAASLDRLKVLAVMSNERLEKYPDIPTAKENGVDWEMVGFRGLAVPKQTPDEVFQQLAEVCMAIGESEDYAAFMEKTGYRIDLRGPEEFAEFLAEEDEKWTEVIQKAGLAKK